MTCKNLDSLFFRWAFLQEILNNWQSYRSEEKRLSEWLAEKEKNLKEVSQVDLGDKMALSVQLQQLKVSFLLFFLFRWQNLN